MELGLDGQLKVNPVFEVFVDAFFLGCHRWRGARRDNIALWLQTYSTILSPIVGSHGGRGGQRKPFIRFVYSEARLMHCHMVRSMEVIRN